MKTTFIRIFSAFLVIFLIAQILVGTAFQLLTKSFLEGRNIETLKNNCSAISKTITAYYNDQNITEKDFIINLAVASEVSQADIIICSADGKLVICSDSPMGCEHQGLAITDEAFIRQVIDSDYVIQKGVIDGLYDDHRYVVCAPLRDIRTQKLYGIVIVSTPTAATQQIMKKLNDTYNLVAVLVFVVALIVIAVYARRNSRPLRSMARAAIAFGHGNLQTRVEVSKGATNEIKNLALAFNNMAQSLEKSEEQRKDFVASVSHELKTPMTTISGYVDGILDGTIPADQQNHYLQIVSHETKRLSRLVRNMLDISRLQEQGGVTDDKKTRFAVSEIAGQVLLSFEKQITEKNLQVQVDIPEMPVYTFACQDHITQVLYNLVDNGVKFCHEDGLLGLQVKEMGNKVYISVVNTGETIPEEELPLLFHRFHKVDKSRGRNRDSWGLGLYIVKTIICSHGEDIAVTSKNGRTQFTFTLPAVNQAN